MTGETATLFLDLEKLVSENPKDNQRSSSRCKAMHFVMVIVLKETLIGYLNCFAWCLNPTGARRINCLKVESKTRGHQAIQPNKI